MSSAKSNYQILPNHSSAGDAFDAKTHDLVRRSRGEVGITTFQIRPILLVESFRFEVFRYQLGTHCGLGVPETDESDPSSLSGVHAVPVLQTHIPQRIPEVSVSTGLDCPRSV
jgi:hypothetical protein